MTGDGFLARPAAAGAIGALMDEYGRAADDLCRVVEQMHPERWARERASADPETVSPRRIGVHLVRAAHGYHGYIRTARGIAAAAAEVVAIADDALAAPAELRPRLGAALGATEDALDGLYEADEATVAALRFEVRWGPTYDPEMLLEHAIVHLLRHRRQLLRWP